MIVSHLQPNNKETRVAFNGPGYILIAELGAAGAKVADAVSKAASDVDDCTLDPLEIIEQIYVSMIAHLTKEIPGMDSEVQEPEAHTNPASYLTAENIPDGLHEKLDRKRRRCYRPN